MFRQLLVCLLLVVFVNADKLPHPLPPLPAGAPTAPAAGKAPDSQPPEVKVSPDDPVITIKGFCCRCRHCRATPARPSSPARNSKNSPTPSNRNVAQHASPTGYGLLPHADDVLRWRKNGASTRRPTSTKSMHFARMQILVAGTQQGTSGRIQQRKRSGYPGLLPEERRQLRASHLRPDLRSHRPSRLQLRPATPKKAASKAGAPAEASNAATPASEKHTPRSSNRRLGEEAMKKEAAGCARADDR